VEGVIVEGVVVTEVLVMEEVVVVVFRVVLIVLVVVVVLCVSRWRTEEERMLFTGCLYTQTCMLLQLSLEP
jgi:type IV secretory pathway VirB3-like protein